MPLRKESLQQWMTVNPPPPPEINAVYFKDHLTDTVSMKEICNWVPKIALLKN